MEKCQRIITVLLSEIAMIASCIPHSVQSAEPSISRASFGKLPDGTAITLYTLRNAHRMKATIATYGGILTSLTVPDRKGKYADVVLGYDNLAGYLKSSPYFGGLIGRYGNRIANARFVLNGHEYTLIANDGKNSLHGGKRGFDKVIWEAVSAEVTSESQPQLTLRYLSKDGEEGYPGNLAVTARYILTDDNALRLDYTATTDKDTVLNLTHHSYFNLKGHGDILGHVLQINASRFTPIDIGFIPTGELRSVANTPFDFRTPVPIGARINNSEQQLLFGKGYDHNWVIDGLRGESILQATIHEPESGRTLEVLSTEPGLQFYSGNFLDGSLVGKGGRRYERRSGFCVEPQHFPDSPNHPAFPHTELNVGQTYHSTIIYRFTTS